MPSLELASSDQKEGTFEWIMGWQHIEPYFRAEHLGIPAQARGEARVLVIGCGTSNLSRDIARIGFGHVTSCDNDAFCVEHMKQLTRESEDEESKVPEKSARSSTLGKLRWCVYDMVERTGDPFLAAPSIQPQKENDRAAPKTPGMVASSSTGFFDVIVDKGTLDAILVEGVVSPMLCEVRRLLKPGGRYVLASINPKQILEPLLSAAPLEMERVILHQVDGVKVDQIGSSDACALVAICTKIGSASQTCGSESGETQANVEYRTEQERESALAKVEKDTMDSFFQQEQPLLSSELAANIKVRHAQQVEKGGGQAEDLISVARAYAVIFKEEEELVDLTEDYTLNLFTEDVEKCFPEVQSSKELSLEDAIKVVQLMQ